MSYEVRASLVRLVQCSESKEQKQASLVHRLVISVIRKAEGDHCKLKAPGLRRECRANLNASGSFCHSEVLLGWNRYMALCLVPSSYTGQRVARK